jgi:hypothetical protein
MRETMDKVDKITKVPQTRCGVILRVVFEENKKLLKVLVEFLFLVLLILFSS